MIQGETCKTSEKKVCYAKYSVGARFSYNLPFTACTESLKIFLTPLLPAGCQTGLPTGGTLMRIKGRKKVEPLCFNVLYELQCRFPGFLIHDGYRNVSIKGGLTDFG